MIAYTVGCVIGAVLMLALHAVTPPAALVGLLISVGLGALVGFLRDRQ